MRILDLGRFSIMALIVGFVVIMIFMGKSQSHEPKFSSEKWIEAASTDYSLREPMCGELVAKLLTKTEADVIRMLGRPNSRASSSYGLDLNATILRYNITDLSLRGAKPKNFEVTISKDAVVTAGVADAPSPSKPAP